MLTQSFSTGPFESVQQRFRYARPVAATQSTDAIVGRVAVEQRIEPDNRRMGLTHSKNQPLPNHQQQSPNASALTTEGNSHHNLTPLRLHLVNTTIGIPTNVAPMTPLTPPAPQQYMLQNLTFLREYAKRVIVEGDSSLTPLEDVKDALIQEVWRTGDTFKLTKRDVVILMYKGVLPECH